MSVNNNENKAGRERFAAGLRYGLRAIGPDRRT